MTPQTVTLHVESRTGLRELAPVWDALVVRQPLPSPFLRSWWIDNAPRHRPFVLAVRDGDRLVGGLALEEDRRLGVPRLLAAGSTLAPDHVDVISEPDLEPDVTAALREWFHRRGSRVVDVTCAPGVPRLADALPGAKVEVVEGAPWTPLTPDFEGFLASRPSKLRQSVGRHGRRLARDGVVYRRVEGDAVGRALADLRRLHALVFGSRSLFLPYFDRFAVTARAGAARGEVVVHELVVGAQVIASVVTFEVAGRVSYYQTGRDTDHRWRGAGTYLEHCLLERACQNGMVEFDHLRGREGYKQMWAPEMRALTRVVSSHGPLGGAARWASTTAVERLGGVARRMRMARRS